MIIETEASKDIPRCLAYPENEPGPFRLWLFADSTFRDSGLTRRLQCPYRVFYTVSFGWIFFIIFFLPLLYLNGFWLCGHFASDFHSNDLLVHHSRSPNSGLFMLHVHFSVLDNHHKKFFVFTHFWTLIFLPGFKWRSLARLIIQKNSFECQKKKTYYQPCVNIPLLKQLMLCCTSDMSGWEQNQIGC